jgi:hypothetical protein
MREIIKLKSVSVRNDAEACVTRLVRETWHLCVPSNMLNNNNNLISTHSTLQYLQI